MFVCVGSVQMCTYTYHWIEWMNENCFFFPFSPSSHFLLCTFLLRLYTILYVDRCPLLIECLLKKRKKITMHTSFVCSECQFVVDRKCSCCWVCVCAVKNIILYFNVRRTRRNASLNAWECRWKIHTVLHSISNTVSIYCVVDFCTWSCHVYACIQLHYIACSL